MADNEKYTTYEDNMDNIDPRGQFSYAELKDFADMYWLKSLNRCARKRDFSAMERYLTDDIEMVVPYMDIEPPFFGKDPVIRGKEAVMKAITEDYVRNNGLPLIEMRQYLAHQQKYIESGEKEEPSPDISPLT